MRWRDRKSREWDLDRELHAHLGLEADKQHKFGLTLEQACYARRSDGGLEIPVIGGEPCRSGGDG
jgi:hypothetical protein